MLSPFSVDADFIHDCAANDRAAIVLHQEARCVFAAREEEAHRNCRPTEPTAEYSAARAREREESRKGSTATGRICKVDFAFDENDDDDDGRDGGSGESVMDGRSGQQTVLLARSVGRCALKHENRRGLKRPERRWAQPTDDRSERNMAFS